MTPTALVWFRRDLRDDDHAALSRALREAQRVYCAFVFDPDLLAGLPPDDRRVDFIHRSLVELDRALRGKGGGLIVRHGRPSEEIPRLAAEVGAAAVYVNADYEPFARRRDAAVAERLARAGRRLQACKDQVIFAPEEILSASGAPFAVFSPYARAWRKRLAESGVTEHACAPRPGQLAVPPAPTLPTLAQIGFRASDLAFPAGMTGAERLLADFLTRIERYHETRDFPAMQGVSCLSPHLRFGTISIRRLVRLASERIASEGSRGAEAWLSELIWREFFQMILWHRPDTVDHAFRREADALVWENAPEHLSAWQEGRTGYPLVDAAMRQLLQTGWMHNRLRMVAASFLTKDLGIDWRLGEAHFARWLLDYEQASNVGNWQWVAGVGADAAPYFRIFNPVTQSQRFDPQGRFIRRYVPELAEVPAADIHAPWRMACPPRGYPPPLVDHAQARRQTLARHRAVRR